PAADLAVRPEMTLPKSVVKDHGCFYILAELVRGESRPNERLYPDQHEEILRNERSVHPLRRHRVPRVTQILGKNAISRNLGKYMVALTNIAKCRSGQVRRTLMVLLQSHNLAG